MDKQVAIEFLMDIRDLLEVVNDETDYDWSKRWDMASGIIDDLYVYIHEEAEHGGWYSECEAILGKE